MMKTYSSLLLLGALGALSAAATHAAPAVDTSQWKCETCPFEKAGTSGSLDLGLAAVSDTSPRFGDISGLRRSGAHLDAGGTLRHLAADGDYANLAATLLSPDVASLSAAAGRPGRFEFRLGYDEFPRYFSEGAATPFLGIGSSTLTLPTGYPAATTGAMPLATTLREIELGYKRSRLDLGASWQAARDWSVRLDARRIVRDGTQRSSGAFFASAAQLVAPVDQATDEIDATLAYAGLGIQATLGYHASVFRNEHEGLTWTNPFTAGLIAGSRGQLALAPDNQFHQVQATLGWQIDPRSRASADLAIGRMTQDAAYLASTLNGDLAVPGLPTLSLHGRAATLNASVRYSTAPTDRLRLSASLTRNERDNETPVNSYPSVSTDMFLGLPRSNQPFSFAQNRLKLNADYNGPGSMKLALGAEQDTRQRTLQEVGSTREWTIFGRLSAKPLDKLGVTLKLAHAERNQADYRNVAWIDPAENPLLRKFNLAERTRQSASGRAEWALDESWTVGFDLDLSIDNYRHSTIGLTDGRSVGAGIDASGALTEQTQLQLFARSDRIDSRQAGSQQSGTPDWSANNKDVADVLGLGLRHSALKGALELGADVVVSRSRARVSVDTGALDAAFPAATTGLDSLRLSANYRLSDQVTLLGSFWYEHYDTRDWKLDGVSPAAVPNLLSLGEIAPRYRVNVLRLALRYRF